MRHAFEPPRPDEPVHLEHVQRGLQLQLQREGVDAGSVRWTVHVPRTDNYILIDDGPPDVTITATRSALVRFLTTPPPRNLHPDDVEISGKPAAVREFLTAIGVFPPVAAEHP